MSSYIEDSRMNYLWNKGNDIDCDILNLYYTAPPNSEYIVMKMEADLRHEEAVTDGRRRYWIAKEKDVSTMIRLQRAVMEQQQHRIRDLERKIAKRQKRDVEDAIKFMEENFDLLV